MSREKLVRKVNDFEDAMTGMKVQDASGQAAEVEPQAKLSSKEKQSDGIPRIQPSYRIPVGPVKNKYTQETYEYLWEYVAGMYENMLQIGSGISFNYVDERLPGDDYCRWDIPANKPIKIPRFLAQHLSKNLAWKEMKPLAKNEDPKAVEDYEITKPFQDFIVKKRGTFQPLSAF